MKLSVAVCTYNREKYLPQLFESIRRQTLDPKSYELILVNNNSTDNTKQLCLDFIAQHQEIDCKYFEETNQGLSWSRNRSIRESSGDLIVFLDDDAHAREDYFQQLIDCFEKEPQLSAIGGRILLDYESVIPAWENKYLNSLLGYYDPGDKQFYYTSSDYPRGSNMAFRLSLFTEIGDFNVELGRIGRNLLGGEEKDLFRRIYATRHHQVKYDPNLVVFHCVPPERTTSAFIERQGTLTGASERIRTLNQGKAAFAKRWAEEVVKWGGSLVISAAYLVQGKSARASMILKFRSWVSKGLLRGNQS